MSDQPPPPPPPPPGSGYPPPPPGSGYPPPPPPGGGYPPPPPPGGGYPPPPPPQQGGYQPPPPTQQAFYPPQQGNYPAPGGYPPPAGPGYPGAQALNVGEAFSWSWNKFSKNAAALIVPTLIYAGIVLIVGIVTWVLAGLLAPETTVESYGYNYSYEASFGFASILVLIVGYLILLVVAAAIQSAFLGGLLDIANGQPVTIGSFFKPRNVGSVIIASLIIGVAAGILSFCFIGGIAVSLFTLFATVIIVDRNTPPIDALKQSFEITKNNFVPVILALLVIYATVAVGALVCGIGLIVALPVAGLFLVYTYRKLTGGQVAPLTP
jgi:uncharacterized membrane protein